MKNLEWFTTFMGTAANILPITLFLILFQVFFLKKPIENVKTFVLGIVLTTVGLHFFLSGMSISLIPLGESVGRKLLDIDHKWIIVLFGFVLL